MCQPLELVNLASVIFYMQIFLQRFELLKAELQLSLVLRVCKNISFLKNALPYQLTGLSISLCVPMTYLKMIKPFQNEFFCKYNVQRKSTKSGASTKYNWLPLV